MYIYKTTNLINNKIYIGLSTKSVEESTKYYGSGILIKEAIQKYGKENFTKEIIENHIENFDTLKVREIYWIEYFKSYTSYDNYNLTLGGDGSLGLSPTKFTKNKISKTLKGYIHSKETKEKMSNSGKGRQFSEETKDKLSKSNKGQKRSEKTKENISKSLKGVPNPKKNVQCTFCNKIGASNNMNRYHFNNCKNK